MRREKGEIGLREVDVMEEEEWRCIGIHENPFFKCIVNFMEIFFSCPFFQALKRITMSEINVFWEYIKNYQIV